MTIDFDPVYKVDTRRGAPMARPDVHASFLPEKRVRLNKLRIDDGGYDNGGAYWGLGEPLYCAYYFEDDDQFVLYFRAKNRTAAREYLQEYFDDVAQDIDEDPITIKIYN